jgi:hypothetical protein
MQNCDVRTKRTRGHTGWNITAVKAEKANKRLDASVTRSREGRKEALMFQKEKKVVGNNTERRKRSTLHWR